MTSANPAHFAFRLGARTTAVTGAYLAATAAVLLTVIALRSLVTPALLRSGLGVIFVASLAAGLEPGTVKAAALAEGGVDGVGLVAYLGVGAGKAILASPILAILWRFADPGVQAGALIWAPFIAIAGFCATDLRVLLDLKGRYASAIALKQGGLAGGIVLMGVLLALRAPLFWAIGVSTLARLGFLALVLSRVATRGREGSAWAQARRLLTDRRWFELAAVSVIGAASGSADRVFGLRYFSPIDYGGYYLTYELLTKFWLIPYVLSPILFARQAAGDADAGFRRGAWSLTAVAGVAFLAMVAALQIFAPTLLARVIGAAFGAATLGFAGAVVIGAFGQLRLAELQGSHRSRQAAIAMGLSALVSIPLFFGAARMFGPQGLLLAWLAKTGFELAALSWRGQILMRPV